AGQIGADDHAIRASEVQRHLTRPAADFDDRRVAGDGAVEETRERASFGTRPQPVQAVARWVAGERLLLVEPADGFCARVRRQTQIRYVVGRVELPAAPTTSQVRGQR